MTRPTPLNGFLIAGGVAVAVAIWAGAFLLPAPAPRGPSVTATEPDATPAPTVSLPALAAPETTAPEPQVDPAATAVAQDPGPASVAVASAPVDPAAFGSLQMSMEPPAPQQRVSILDAAGSVPLASLSLAATPLQSIGATFAEPVPGMALPEFGGASALNGPADAGLDSPVARSDEADASGPSAPPPRGKIIAIDASEGTKIDPLRQRNWDLNAVQVIPPMPNPASPPSSGAPPRR